MPAGGRGGDGVQLRRAGVSEAQRGKKLRRTPRHHLGAPERHARPVPGEIEGRRERPATAPGYRDGFGRQQSDGQRAGADESEYGISVEPVDGFGAESVDGFGFESINGFSFESINGVGIEPIDGVGIEPIDGVGFESINGFSFESINGVGIEPIDGVGVERGNGAGAEPVDGFGAEPGHLDD
ncbi:MAG: hypothetical protein ACRD1M_17360 [Terriglobales bacterium]